MNFIRKAATTLGAVFFAALLITALAPKTARGVAAALVQVTNTASNAVATEDGPGNFPFAASVCAESGNSDCGNVASAFSVPLTTFTGAAVKRLVIEDVSAVCNMDQGDVISAGVSVPFPADNVDSLNQGILQYFFPPTLVGDVFIVAHSPARIYADAGAGVSTSVFGFLVGSHGASCNMYLSGHLETK
jgi:hypothetical protein